jgi:hypothetical protein
MELNPRANQKNAKGLCRRMGRGGPELEEDAYMAGTEEKFMKSGSTVDTL